MDLQSYFNDFNNTIRMDYSKKKELAEKRDILITKLKEDETVPSFSSFNQGSYSMHTGIKPVGDEDYDIDVGLCFDVSCDEYEPTTLKSIIHDVIKNHTEYGAEVKGPCVTIYYKKENDIAFHVDFAVYANLSSDSEDEILYLDRGKLCSKEESKYWERSQPTKLKRLINDRVEDKDKRSQYRRIIRYLKRWNKEHCVSCSVPGIGLTLLVYEYYNGSRYDRVLREFVPDDLLELISIVDKIISRFIAKYDSEKNEFLYSIIYTSPVEPGRDIFSKMTLRKQNDFYLQLLGLKSKLQKVYDEIDLVKQCEILRGIFGNDFPVPEKKDVSEKQVPINPPKSSTSGLYEI